jgi:scyllo-inositol 2-dehydrogenase (NADP+)
MSRMDVRVGIIGFGRIGAEHASWLANAQRIRATTIFDPTPARRSLAASRQLGAVDSIDAILDDKNIDAVLISTPTSMHFDHASAALRAGKHVMVEKPMALDLPQSKQLVDVARQHDGVLSVFHNRRWDIDYLTARRAIDEGVFGRIINIESRIGQWASCVGPAAREWRPGWRNESTFGGGGLYDWGSHFLDQLWRMMLPAKPTRVFAQLRGNIWSNDCDDLARVCIDFDDGSGKGGAVGVVEINTTTTRPLPRWHIDGTLGSADSPHSLAFDLNTWANFTFTPASMHENRTLPLASPGLTETEIWEQFAAAMRGEADPAVPAESVLPTMALLDAARESARTGHAISLSQYHGLPARAEK